MLTRGLLHDTFTQDSADRSCGEERCAKRFIRVERISNLEDACFGALAIRLRRFVFLYALVQLPSRATDLPGCEQNFKSIDNCESFLNRLAGTWQIVFGDGHSRLQIPRERLQIRIAGSQRGLL